MVTGSLIQTLLDCCCLLAWGSISRSSYGTCAQKGLPAFSHTRLPSRLRSPILRAVASREEQALQQEGKRGRGQQQLDAVWEQLMAEAAGTTGPPLEEEVREKCRWRQWEEALELLEQAAREGTGTEAMWR